MAQQAKRLAAISCAKISRKASAKREGERKKSTASETEKFTA